MHIPHMFGEIRLAEGDKFASVLFAFVERVIIAVFLFCCSTEYHHFLYYIIARIPATGEKGITPLEVHRL